MLYPVLSFVFGLLCLGAPWLLSASPLPWRELLIVGMGVVLALPLLWRLRATRISGTTPFALLFILFVALSGMNAHTPHRMVFEAAQVGLYFLILPMLVSRFPSVPGLGWGLLLGLIGAGGIGLGERIAGGTLHGSGILDNRFIFGGAWTALGPLTLVLVGEQLRNRPRAQLAGGVALAFFGGVALTSVPMALLFGLGVAATAVDLFARRLPRTLVVGAWGLAAVLTLGVFQRERAAAGIVLHATDGTPRRWVQECVAAVRAVQDAPVLGHGPGTFQQTVSSGFYRRDLPRPGETKVERGMESGVLVRAVENGLPAAIALFATFLAAFLATRHRIGDERPNALGRAAGLGLLLLGVSAFFTPITTRAGGALCGVLLGLALRHDSRRGWPQPLAWLSRALPQAGLCALALAAAFFWWNARAEHAARVHARGPARTAMNLMLEAEQGEKPAVCARIATGTGASSGRYIELPDGVLITSTPTQLAEFTFNVPRPVRAAVWFRVRWKDGCGNSVAAAIDRGAPLLVGNDGTYAAWHWVRGFDTDLSAGPHVLKLVPREDGIAIDQILLTSDSTCVPAGVLGVDAVPVPHAGPGRAQESRLPPTPRHERPEPFLVGVGGCYRGGFEAACIEMGLPFGKVEDSDLTRPERLAKYRIICLSEPRLRQPSTPMFAALERFVKAGGTVVLENYSGRVASRFAGEFLPSRTAGRLSAEYGGTLQTDDSPWFEGIPPGAKFKMARDVPFMVPSGRPGPEWTSFGKVLRYGSMIGPALFQRDLGKGKVLFSSIPFSFHTMWRGAALAPPLRTLLAELTRDRCLPVAPVIDPQVRPPAADIFADDFMRAGPGLGPAWQTAGHGTAICTGERGPLPHTEFSLMLTDSARVRAASARATPEWAFSTALTVASGAGGLWVAMPHGEVRVDLDDTGQLGLIRRTENRSWTMARAALPTGNGWHRLSLVHTRGAWTVFARGKPRLRVAEIDRERPTGEFGLFCRTGKTFFDDVRGCFAAALVPGTDRCRGEEGSTQAWDGLSHKGIEKHTVYSLPWLTRPSPRFDNALRLVLPNFVDGVLALDGRLTVRVPAGANPAVVTVPAPKQVRHSIGFVCPGWRDYVFHGRLTDWYSVGADWSPKARWSCDPRWYWLGAETQDRTGLWYWQELTPPYAVSAVVSVGARRYFREEYRRGRDMNLTLGGDGHDVTSGMTVRIMSAADGGIQVWDGDAMIHRTKDRGLPSGHSLHHNWFVITAIVTRKRLRVGFEGKEVVDLPLEKPIGKGRIAVWTQRNSIRVARVTVSINGNDMRVR